MRLNGWQRIGIVASVIWAIGAPIYWDQAAQTEANAKFSFWYNLCRDGNRSSDECNEQARHMSDLVPRYYLGSANGAFIGLVPIPLGWLLAYALVYLGRWIRAGFR
jgi:hypothetical protein